MGKISLDCEARQDQEISPYTKHSFILFNRAIFKASF